MAANDLNTIAWYDAEAAVYTSRGKSAKTKALDNFMRIVRPGGSVLELGCGAGQDSEALLTAGFDVTPTDGTAAIAAAAEKRLGRPVRVMLFEELDERSAYDGVWANACLLHVPRAELGPILDRVHAAMKPGGVFYATFKAGEAEGRDKFGRYYNYPDEEWLRQTYRPERWQSLEIGGGTGSGYDGVPTNWLNVLAVKFQ